MRVAALRQSVIDLSGGNRIVVMSRRGGCIPLTELRQLLMPGLRRLMAEMPGPQWVGDDHV